MIQIKNFKDTLPILLELRKQNFSDEKKGHPEVFFPNEKTNPLLFSFFSSIANDLNKNLIFLQANRFRKNDSAPWHNDLEPGTDTLGMLYLTESFYDFEDLGSLQIGWKRENQVLPITAMCPNLGNFVLLDNTLPELVHRVLCVSGKERFSVLGFFGQGDPIFR
jgi:hypothetical protein